MSIILKDMTVISQQPVAVGAPFPMRLDFERFPPDGQDHATSVKLWCEAAYSVSPAALAVGDGAGANEFSLTAQVTLQGAGGQALVRILGQCDEIQSVVVEVK